MRSKRDRNAFINAFHLNSFYLRSIRVPLLPERIRERVPVTVVIRPTIIGYHRNFGVSISVAFTLCSITMPAMAKHSHMQEKEQFFYDQAYTS